MRVEQRGAGLGERVGETWPDTERIETMTTRLARFTQRARELRRERCTSLMGLLFDLEGLRASFERQDGRKAPGVDGIRKEDYAEGLEERLAELSGRLRRLSYRPKPVRRGFIPTGGGRHRPRGVLRLG